MKVYDFPASPNCRKVRAVAYELGLPVTYVHVDFFRGEARTPAFLARNPNARVPVLEDGEFVLWESNAILAYLARGSALLPEEPRARADVDRWLAWQLAHFGPAVAKVAFERIVKPLTRGLPADAAIVDAATAEFRTHAAVLEACLDRRDYVAGALSIADFALAAVASVAEPAGLRFTELPRTAAWLARMTSRPSMARALDDARVSIEGMRAAANARIAS